MTRGFGFVMLMCVICFSWLDLQAQSNKPAKQDTANFDVQKRKQDVKLFLDKIEILGRIEKPQTVFIVQGQDPSVDDIQIDRSFFQEIFRPVEWDMARKLIEKNRRRQGRAR